MMFLKTAAATLLRRFHFSTPADGPKSVQDIRPIFSLTLHVKGGVRVVVRRRASGPGPGPRQADQHTPPVGARACQQPPNDVVVQDVQ